MKSIGKFVAVALVFCGVLLGVVAPAQAESITLIQTGVSNSGPLPCLNGCFGNDITIEVNDLNLGYDWTVSITINATGNTNTGGAIGAISFILDGFSFDSADVDLVSAPGGVGAAGFQKAAGPANANAGCQDVSSNSICALDVSLYSASPSDADAPINIGGGAGPVHTWVFGIDDQTFGGFDSDTHIQVVFGNLILSGPGCPGGPDASPCFKETGLISTGPGQQVPEPTSLTLLGLGLGVAAVVRRRMVK